MINSLLNRNKVKDQPSRLRDKNGKIINQPEQVAEKFNSFFSNIATNLKSEMDPSTQIVKFSEFLKPETQSSIQLKPVNPGEIRYIIDNFKNKSTLDTKISALKIASAHNLFIEAVSDILNESLTNGIFPEQLKIAKVVPIHKGDDKLKVENYRPISLLTTFSKIFEKIMYRRIYDFLTENETLDDYQFGFRQGRSCEQAVLTAQKTILDNLSKNQISLLLLIDFSKAFDMVDHKILLEKLRHYGIRGKAWEWIKSYLSNREQYVSIGASESSREKILYGVPQGSILGPLFFIIYINDIPRVAEFARFILYADDANIIISGDTILEIEEKLAKLIPNLVNWVGGNGLLLNLKKTNFMLFSRRKRLSTIEVKINNVPIKMVSEAKFLGVILDDKLTWKSHINAIKSKMSRYVGILYRIKFHVPLKVRIMIYHSFVQSHLNYCCLVWGFACKSSINSIFTKQKKAMRAIMPGYVNYYFKDGNLPTGTKTSFKEYNILTVHGIIAKTAIMFMHKNICRPNVIPASVRDTIDKDAPKYNLDESNEAIKDWYKNHNTSVFRNSLFFVGPMLFSDPKLSEVVAPRPQQICFKTRAQKIIFEFEHLGEPENWEGSKFIIHELQGIRKSKRIGAST